MASDPPPTQSYPMAEEYDELFTQNYLRHIVYGIVVAWIVQSNLTVANKLLPYRTLPEETIQLYFEKGVAFSTDGRRCEGSWPASIAKYVFTQTTVIRNVNYFLYPVKSPLFGAFRM